MKQVSLQGTMLGLLCVSAPLRQFFQFSATSVISKFVSTFRGLARIKGVQCKKKTFKVVETR